MPIRLRTSALIYDCCKGRSKKFIPSPLGHWKARMPGVRITATGEGARKAKIVPWDDNSSLQSPLDCLCCTLTALILFPLLLPGLFTSPSVHAIFLMSLLFLSLLNNQPHPKYQHKQGPAWPAAPTGPSAHVDKPRLRFSSATCHLLNFTQVPQNSESAPPRKWVSFFRSYIHL